MEMASLIVPDPGSRLCRQSAQYRAIEGDEPKQVVSDTDKRRFWQRHRDLALSAEQIKVLNRLLEGDEKGVEHGISAAQYQLVAKVSKAKATRHLADLLEKRLPDAIARWRPQHALSDQWRGRLKRARSFARRPHVC